MQLTVDAHTAAAVRPNPLSEDGRRMNAYWRAANYLSVGQSYLYDNPR
jgi:phosphoketolase